MKKTKKAQIPLFLVRIYDNLLLLSRFFSKRYRLTGTHKFQEPFFIVGSGRSGNTLLRSMLVAGGQIAIPPESYVWPRVIRKFSSNAYMPWDTLSSMTIAEFESYKEFYTWEMNLAKAHLNARNLDLENRTLSNALNVVYQTYIDEKNLDATRWGDKTPINTIYLDKIIKVFPNAQYIHIKRDPLDVVCSYVKAGFYASHEEAAVFWKASTDKAKWISKKLNADQYIEILYEDLVTKPEVTLRAICKFLKIEYTEVMMDYWKQSDSLGDVKYGEHHENVGKPISASSIGKWKKVLSEQEALKIRQIVYPD